MRLQVLRRGLRESNKRKSQKKNRNNAKIFHFPLDTISAVCETLNMKQIKANDKVMLDGIEMIVREIGTRHGRLGIILLAPNGDDIIIWEGTKLWKTLRVAR